MDGCGSMVLWQTYGQQKASLCQRLRRHEKTLKLDTFGLDYLVDSVPDVLVVFALGL